LAKNGKNSQFLAHCCEIGAYDINFLGLLHSSAAIWQQLFHLDRYGKKKFSKSYRIFPKNINFSKNWCFLGTPLRGHIGGMVNLRFFLGSLGTQLLNTFYSFPISFKIKKLHTF